MEGSRNDRQGAFSATFSSSHAILQPLRIMAPFQECTATLRRPDKSANTTQQSVVAPSARDELVLPLRNILKPQPPQPAMHQYLAKNGQTLLQKKGKIDTLFGHIFIHVFGRWGSKRVPQGRSSVGRLAMSHVGSKLFGPILFESGSASCRGKGKPRHFQHISWKHSGHSLVHLNYYLHHFCPVNSIPFSQVIVA